MKYSIYLIVLSIVLASCGSQDSYYNYDLSDKGKKNMDYKSQDTSKHYEGMSLKDMSYHTEVDTNIAAKTILYEKSVNRYFSNSIKKDVFKVSIHGDHYYNASIDFTIKNADGEEIYHENYPCMQILDEAFDGGGNYATDIQRQDYMKKYVFDFFDSKNFRMPAIDPERDFVEEFSNKENWDEIKTDTFCVGFTYVKHAQNKTEIAFNKKKNAVVKFYQY